MRKNSSCSSQQKEREKRGITEPSKAYCFCIRWYGCECVCARSRQTTDEEKCHEFITNSCFSHNLCIFISLRFLFLSFDLLLFGWNLLLQSDSSCLLRLAVDIRFFNSFDSSSFFSFLSNSIWNLLPIDCDTAIKSNAMCWAYHLLSLPLCRFVSFWIRITRITLRKMRI